MPGDGALLAPDWVPWAERLAEYHAHQAGSPGGARRRGIRRRTTSRMTTDDDDGLDDDRRPRCGATSTTTDRRSCTRATSTASTSTTVSDDAESDDDSDDSDEDDDSDDDDSDEDDDDRIRRRSTTTSVVDDESIDDDDHEPDEVTVRRDVTELTPSTSSGSRVNLGLGSRSSVYSIARDELAHVVGLDRDEGRDAQLVAAELAVGLGVDDAVGAQRLARAAAASTLSSKSIVTTTGERSAGSATNGVATADASAQS